MKRRLKKIRGMRERLIGAAADRQWDLILIARRMRPRRERGISARKGERGIANPKGWRKTLLAGSKPGLRGPRSEVFRTQRDPSRPRLDGSHRKKGN